MPSQIAHCRARYKAPYELQQRPHCGRGAQIYSHLERFNGADRRSQRGNGRLPSQDKAQILEALGNGQLASTLLSTLSSVRVTIQRAYLVGDRREASKIFGRQRAPHSVLVLVVVKRTCRVVGEHSLLASCGRVKKDGRSRTACPGVTCGSDARLGRELHRDGQSGQGNVVAVKSRQGLLVAHQAEKSLCIRSQSSPRSLEACKWE